MPQHRSRRFLVFLPRAPSLLPSTHVLFVNKQARSARETSIHGDLSRPHVAVSILQKKRKARDGRKRDDGGGRGLIQGLSKALFEYMCVDERPRVLMGPGGAARAMGFRCLATTPGCGLIRLTLIYTLPTQRGESSFACVQQQQSPRSSLSRGLKEALYHVTYEFGAAGALAELLLLLLLALACAIYVPDICSASSNIHKGFYSIFPSLSVGLYVGLGLQLSVSFPLLPARVFSLSLSHLWLDPLTRRVATLIR